MRLGIATAPVYLQAAFSPILKPSLLVVDNDLFKENIARCCTHTILAACRIENSKFREQNFEVVYLIKCQHEQILK